MKLYTHESGDFSERFQCWLDSTFRMYFLNFIKVLPLLVLLSLTVGCVGGSTDSKPISVKQEYTGEVRHAENLIQKKTPSFKVEVAYPFVITGDLDGEELLKWKSRVVRSQRALKKLFFKEDPSEVMTVWLFKSTESYNKYNKQLWGITPNTPYGYYIPKSKRMVMNIATGGGTLTHELVHPYITENIPKSPLWFHEGLATLYEQSRYSGGKIYGMNNWRLHALQQGIKNNTLPSLAVMMRSGAEFYGINREIYYAQARYLMFYLQSKSLLVKYYEGYRDTVTTDPSGVGLLLKITNKKSMSSFEASWKDFVLKQYL